MKKAVLLTIVMAIVGYLVYDFVQAQPWLHPQPQKAQEKVEPSKYDVGSPDPQEILELVNEERKRIGVPPLQYDPYVAKSAQLKADDMVAKDYRQHNIPGLGDMYTPEMRKLLYQDAKCARSGENLSWSMDKNIIGTSRGVFDSWMESKPHREAMQSASYQRTGIGTVGDLAVQHFCANK